MDIFTVLDDQTENDVLSRGVKFLDEQAHYGFAASAPRYGELEWLHYFEEGGGLVALKTGEVCYSVYGFEPFDPQDEGTQAVLDERSTAEKITSLLVDPDFDYQIRGARFSGTYTEFDDLLEKAEDAVGKGEIVGVVETSRRENSVEDLLPDNYTPITHRRGKIS